MLVNYTGLTHDNSATIKTQPNIDIYQLII